MWRWRGVNRWRTFRDAVGFIVIVIVIVMHTQASLCSLCNFISVGTSLIIFAAAPLFLSCKLAKYLWLSYIYILLMCFFQSRSCVISKYFVASCLFAIMHVMQSNGPLVTKLTLPSEWYGGLEPCCLASVICHSTWVLYHRYSSSLLLQVNAISLA